MGAGTAADDPLANNCDLLPLFHGVAGGYHDLVDMPVLGDDPIAMVDLDEVTVSTGVVIVTGHFHGALGNRYHRSSSSLSGNINTIMENAIPVSEGRRNGRASRRGPDIRDLICCQTCGKKLTRINHRDDVYIIWKCPSCHTETRYLPDRELISSVLSAINKAIMEPQKIRNIKKNTDCLSIQAVRLENEIHRELGNPKADSKRLLESIKQCAQEKYKACHANGDSEQTKHLIVELSKLQPMEHFQPQILREFICKILITPAGAVSIQFKNGAIL